LVGLRVESGPRQSRGARGIYNCSREASLGAGGCGRLPIKSTEPFGSRLAGYEQIDMKCHLSKFWNLARRHVILGLALAVGGCQWFADDADRQVYRLVEKRQTQALGETHDARITRGQSPVSVPGEAYSFVPRPTDSGVPEAFLQTASAPAATTRPTSLPAATATQPADSPESMDVIVKQDLGTQPSLTQFDTAATTQPSRPILTLSDALRYAFHHSRRFQDAKEDLYIAALNLTLERHLWTPIPFANFGQEYTNVGSFEGWDAAMESVAQAGVRQKLPYGGDVTARIIANLVRDVSDSVSTGETGAAILEANLPLLRGAGRSAYESRYQAERNLIYAVRTFENFRRTLAVTIAGEYFELQGTRQTIINAHETVQALTLDQRRAEALWRTGRTDQLDVLRADQDRIRASNAEVDAIAGYETSLDRFKILIGMPTETEIDVEYPAEGSEAGPTDQAAMEPASLEDALRMPVVSEEEAIRVALKYRLDLLNDLDRIDDARRGVAVAENDLLPDLQAFGSVQMDTRPDVDSVLGYNSELITYRAGLRLEIPLDRVAERNALRRSQITLQQADRNYEEAKDTVSLQVRESMRQVQLQLDSLEIQRRNKDVAMVRRRAARMWFDLGKKDNRDVVEAQQNLLEAQDRLAAAVAALRRAILTFRLNTGTLRVNDQGQWNVPVAQTAAKG
jgi:outer membrane protein TolC